MNKYEFGKLIREERIKKRITYEKFSEMTGFSVKAICRWEKGDVSITLTNANEVLNALGFKLKIIKNENP